MESEKFLLWNARHGGWVTGGATITSDRNQARRFTQSEALKQAKVYLGQWGAEFGVLPVSETMLDEIKDPTK